MDYIKFYNGMRPGQDDFDRLQDVISSDFQSVKSPLLRTGVTSGLTPELVGAQSNTLCISPGSAFWGNLDQDTTVTIKTPIRVKGLRELAQSHIPDEHSEDTLANFYITMRPKKSTVLTQVNPVFNNDEAYFQQYTPEINLCYDAVDAPFVPTPFDIVLGELQYWMEDNSFDLCQTGATLSPAIKGKSLLPLSLCAYYTGFQIHHIGGWARLHGSSQDIFSYLASQQLTPKQTHSYSLFASQPAHVAYYDDQDRDDSGVSGVLELPLAQSSAPEDRYLDVSFWHLAAGLDSQVQVSYGEQAYTFRGSAALSQVRCYFRIEDSAEQSLKLSVMGEAMALFDPVVVSSPHRQFTPGNIEATESYPPVLPIILSDLKSLSRTNLGTFYVVTDAVGSFYFGDNQPFSASQLLSPPSSVTEGADTAEEGDV